MKENKKIKQGNYFAEGIKRIFDFDFSITKERIPHFLPFILYLAFLVILYIANKYYAEKSYLKETNLNRELKELRAESLTIKAELINKTKQSEVIDRAAHIGLEEIKMPPKKIIISKDEY